MMPGALVLAAALASGAAPTSPYFPPATDHWLAAVRALPVQDGGRVKPLDTYAREAARRVSGARAFGAESIRGLEPTEWLLGMMASPERWRGEPIVRVSHAELRQAVGLPGARDRYSFAELAAHEPLLRAAESAQEKARADEDAVLSPIEKESLDLYGNLVLMQEIFDGSALRLVPGEDPATEWTSLAALLVTHDSSLQGAARSARLLLDQHAAGQRAGVATAAAELARELGARGSGVSATDIRRELQYNRVKPFRLAWVLSLVAFLALLASFPLGSRVLSGAGFALLAAVFASETWGMAVRTLVSGRAPVTNMYETIVFVSWGAILFALAFEAVYRVRYFAASAAGVSVLMLLLADNVPIFDGSIQPLVPVLRDNFWLTTHVITIMLGYAAFFLGVALGHVNLGLYFFAPGRRELLRRLSLFLYRTLQLGTLFLAAGTLLGGVWASYSWGRFWGWDPKETWALIATLVYLAILHGRFIGWIREFGLAVGSLVGGLSVLMAWYGVNFILGTGLHSYGFGSGGTGYVAGFVAFELAVIAAAFFRKRAAERTPALPVGAAPVAAR
jgi:ABC-type transport system involved in cytochrome c biogenesis permease subunit